MNNYKFVKISSRWTGLSYVGLFILIFLLPLMSVGFFYIAEGGELKWILFALLLLTMTVLSIYCLVYLAKVEIVDNQFHIKKLFRAKQIFPIQSLTKINVIPMRREDYIIFTLEEKGTKERVLVYANKFFLYTNENRQTEKVLREILEENKK